MGQQQQYMNAEVILIDEQKKALRILRKQKSSLGMVKYLVQYEDQQEWECEKAVKDRYPELVEDFNYFSVSGERYDENLLAQKREQFLRLRSYEHAMPDENYPRFKKQTKKIVGAPAKKEKAADKILNKLNQIDVEDPCVIPSQQAPTQLQQQQQQMQHQQQQLSSNQQRDACLRLNAGSNGHHSASDGDAILIQHTTPISQQSQLETLRVQHQQAVLGDTIKEITLCEFKSEFLFQIEWNPRPDRVVPLTEYFSYAQLKAMAPMLLLQFFESQLLEKATQIKFSTIGDFFQTLNTLKSKGDERKLQTCPENVEQAGKQNYQKELEDAYSNDEVEVPQPLPDVNHNDVHNN